VFRDGSTGDGASADVTPGVKQPTPAAEAAPEREITHEPVGEPTLFGAAIADAEGFFEAGRYRTDVVDTAMLSNAAASIAIAHMLHRATLALERLAVATGELVVHYSRYADASVQINRESAESSREFQRASLEHADTMRDAVLGPRSDNPTRN
jgi:hypothetical protein